MRFRDIAAFVLQHATFPQCTSVLPIISPYSSTNRWIIFGLWRAKMLGWLVAQLVSKIFNLSGHDPPTSQTDGRTTCDSKTVLCTVVHRAVKSKANCYHIRLTASFPGQPGLVCTRKAERIWILLKQEMMGGSGISWTICRSSAFRSRQITTPAPITQFLRGKCSFWHPTNSAKVKKAYNT